MIPRNRSLFLSKSILRIAVSTSDGTTWQRPELLRSEIFWI